MAKPPGGYRMVAEDSEPPPTRRRVQQDSVPESVFDAVTGIQAAVAQNTLDIAKLTEAVAKITASWKDSLVKQLGALGLAALGIIGAQRALAPTPPPPQTVVHRSELDIRAESCERMARENNEAYQECMSTAVMQRRQPGRQAEVPQ